jgi:hypothetical protein
MPKLPIISKTVDWYKNHLPLSGRSISLLDNVYPRHVFSCLSQHLLPGFVWLAPRQENQLECQILKLDRCICLHTIQVQLVMRLQDPQRGAQDRVPGRRRRTEARLFTLALFKCGISYCSNRRTCSLYSKSATLFFLASALMVSSQIQRTNWGPAPRFTMRRPRPASTVRRQFAWIVRNGEMTVAITAPIYIFSFFFFRYVQSFDHPNAQPY